MYHDQLALEVLEVLSADHIEEEILVNSLTAMGFLSAFYLIC